MNLISSESIEQIEAIFRCKNPKSIEGIYFYESNPCNLVFSLNNVPNLIFKINKSNNLSTEVRYQNTLAARKICKENGLSLLKIPKPTLIHIGGSILVIVEKKLDLEEDEYVIENQYKNAGPKLNTAIEQLAKFIILTNWTDTCYRNAPILPSPQQEPPFRIVLLDLEEITTTTNNVESQIIGLTGCLYRKGLIRMAINQEQVEIIYAIACEMNLPHLTINDAKKRRLEELEKEKLIKNIYNKKKITKNSLKKVDIATLFDHIDLEDKKKRSLQNAAKYIFMELAERLKLNNKKYSLIRQRQIKLDSIQPIFILGDSEEKNLKRQNRHSKIFDNTKGYSLLVLDKTKRYYFKKSDTVLGIIIDAFIKKGVLIENLTQESDSHWTLQA